MSDIYATMEMGGYHGSPLTGERLLEAIEGMRAAVLLARQSTLRVAPDVYDELLKLPAGDAGLIPPGFRVKVVVDSLLPPGSWKWAR